LTTDIARSGRHRRADAIARLEAMHADTWVATASSSGAVHLAPPSFLGRRARPARRPGRRPHGPERPGLELEGGLIMRDGQWPV
jgi:hypothetical protein